MIGNLPQWLSVGLQAAEILAGFSAFIGSAVVYAARSRFVSKEQLARDREVDRLALEAKWKDHGDMHTKIEGRLDSGANQFARLSQAIAELPGRREHDAIKQGLSDVSGKVGIVSTEVTGIRELLTQIAKPLDIIVAEKLRHHD